MKKLITIISAALLLSTSAFADSQTFVIAGNTQTNIFPQSIKLLSLTALATNSATVLIYDAPGNTITNIVGAYSNLVQYATNVSIIYTNFYGASNGYVLTNALVTQTNSVSAKTNNYNLIFTYMFGSNTTTRIPNISGAFVNGVLVTNQSANTLSLTVEYSGN